MCRGVFLCGGHCIPCPPGIAAVYLTRHRRRFLMVGRPRNLGASWRPDGLAAQKSDAFLGAGSRAVLNLVEDQLCRVQKTLTYASM